MPYLRTAIFVPTILLGSLLIACSQQGTPSSSQPLESPESTVEQEKTAPEMVDMPEMLASDGKEAETHSMEENDVEQLYEDGAHADHDSKHGGTFFMALDNRHHLEGVLERPGLFHVYIYDAYTQPVSAEELGKAQATVIWGNQDGAPEIELKPNAEGTALEGKAPGPVRFPVSLTLLCRFPGASPTSRAELFTFPFSHYSHIDATPHTHPSD